MSDLTPETIAELRRLLADGTPGPWSTVSGAGNVWHFRDEGAPVVVAGHQCAAPRVPDALLIAAAVNALPALLDAAVERDALLAIIDDARHALSADGPKVEPARQVLARALPQTTAWQDRTRHARDNTPPHVIAHRGAQLDAVTAERDALEAMLSGRCLSDITHRDEGHRQSVCMLPEGHAPLAHDDCMGCTWTDADHWQSHAPERLDAELHAIADESQHEGWDSPLVRRVLGRLQRAYDGEARP